MADITIDGSSITGITIDGTDVTEVTIDGTVAWTATQVIDDFEDQNISEYSGDTGAFTVASAAGKNNTYGLSYISTNRNTINSTSGLDYYPSRGDTFRLWVRGQDNISNLNLFFFAVQTEGSVGSIDGYAANFNPQENDLGLYRYDNGSRTLLSRNTSVSYSKDNWYEIEIDWAADNTITYTLYDSGGSVVGSTSATDSTYSSESGIGFQANTGSGGEVYWDYVRTV